MKGLFKQRVIAIKQGEYWVLAYKSWMFTPAIPINFGLDTDGCEFTYIFDSKIQAQRYYINHKKEIDNEI